MTPEQKKELLWMIDFYACLNLHRGRKNSNRFYGKENILWKDIKSIIKNIPEIENDVINKGEIQCLKRK